MGFDTGQGKSKNHMETRFRLVITGAVALSFFVSVIPAFSTAIHVPADQLSIQAGVDAAAPGDTVLVAGRGSIATHSLGFRMAQLAFT